jgi:hypothetical protein
MTHTPMTSDLPANAANEPVPLRSFGVVDVGDQRMAMTSSGHSGSTPWTEPVDGSKAHDG